MRPLSSPCKIKWASIKRPHVSNNISLLICCAVYKSSSGSKLVNLLSLTKVQDTGGLKQEVDHFVEDRENIESK